jgi:hypothetical protein
MASEKLVRKTIKYISETFDLDYDEVKSHCKKIVKAARSNDEDTMGMMEELVDLLDVTSEEELSGFSADVLRIYCQIKELDDSGSERTLRARVWEHFEETWDMESDSEEDSGSDTETETEVESESDSESISEPVAEPLIIPKVRKSKNSVQVPTPVAE